MVRYIVYSVSDIWPFWGWAIYKWPSVVRLTSNCLSEERQVIIIRHCLAHPWPEFDLQETFVINASYCRCTIAMVTLCNNPELMKADTSLTKVRQSKQAHWYDGVWWWSRDYLWRKLGQLKETQSIPVKIFLLSEWQLSDFTSMFSCYYYFLFPCSPNHSIIPLNQSPLLPSKPYSLTFWH